MRLFRLISLIIAVSLSGCSGETKPPVNVVLIYIDDMSWVGTSVQMDDQIPDSKSDFYETPNIAKLAGQGMRFSAAYSASPICSPARASLLTGISPQQLGMTDIIGSRPGSKRYSDYYVGKALIPQTTLIGLPHERKTIAEVLKAQVPNVRTAHFGKWHVGGGGPEQHGFDEGDNSTGNGTTYGYSAILDDPNPKNIFGITNRSIDFMKRAVAEDKPFYLQISHYAVHIPIKSLKKTVDKYNSREPGEKHSNAHYAAMTEDVDTSVAMILRALEDLNIEGQTYVIFTSDNGGSMDVRKSVTSNAPLAKGKTWVWEGGIRVPMFVRGPGIVPGSVSDTPTIGWDIMPTVCGMMSCNGILPRDVEGGNLLPLMKGESEEINRPRGDSLIWSFPHYLTIKGTTPQMAIREGDFKLIRLLETGENQLFNLAADIGETTNIARQNPDIEKQLSHKLDIYLYDIEARLPIRNEAIQITQPLIRAEPIAAANCSGEDILNVEKARLSQKYKSNYLKISLCYPEGWAVDLEDQSIFITDRAERQIWEKYNPDEDFYISASSIIPWLTPEDQKAGNQHSLKDFAEATLHSLKITEKATTEGEITSRKIGKFESIGFALQMGGRFQYQIIIRFGPERMATIAVNGLYKDKARLSAIVDAMARTLKPI